MVVIKSDALIIGSGVAGLMAALRFAKRGKTVAILAKADLKEGSTLYAQGGMSAVPLSETGQPLEVIHTAYTKKVGILHRGFSTAPIIRGGRSWRCWPLAPSKTI
jgi:succinate dehydrogenase/fumarate reductase flavoprotein subunit